MPELIAFCYKNAIVIFKCVIIFETAKKILPITCETAIQNLTVNRKPGSTGSSSVAAERTLTHRCRLCCHIEFD